MAFVRSSNGLNSSRLRSNGMLLPFDVLNVLNDLNLLNDFYLPDTANSCARLPSLRPPFFITTTVSPHWQAYSPSGEMAAGLQTKTMFSRIATANCFGLFACGVII